MKRIRESRGVSSSLRKVCIYPCFQTFQSLHALWLDCRVSELKKHLILTRKTVMHAVKTWLLWLEETRAHCEMWLKMSRNENLKMKNAPGGS